MLNLNTFKTRMTYTSGYTMRDEIIKNSKQLLNATFLDDASANPNIFFWRTTTKVQCRIYDKKFTSSTGVTAKVQTFADVKLSVGDILYDEVSSEYWLCSELFDMHDIYKQGKLILCNFILKFQIPFSRPSTAPLYTLDENGIETLANEQLLVDVHSDIFEYPCVTTNKTQGSGEDEKNIMTLPSGRKSLLLPCDENTILLRNDHRLFLDKHPTEPRPYKITHVDTTKYNYGSKGLILFILEEDKLTKNDRVDLGVCDYIEVEETIKPDGMYINIESNVDKLYIGWETVFTSQLLDSDRNSHDFDAVWSFDINNIPENDFKVTYADNKCIIKIDNNNYDEIYKHLGKVITITCSTSDGLYSATYELPLEAL